MSERAVVLRELPGAKGAHILYPLDGGRAFVGRKALIAKDGEAFLQRKLEPVAAGDAVARPVVEIFMRDDGGDGIEIGVGRGVGIGQDIAGVEDVEALVRHLAASELDR